MCWQLTNKYLRILQVKKKVCALFIWLSFNDILNQNEQLFFENLVLPNFHGR